MFEVIIYIANRHEISGDQGLCGCGLGRDVGEVGAALAVGEGDGHGCAVHAVEEDRWGARVVLDFDHAEACFVLFIIQNQYSTLTRYGSESRK